MTGHMVESSEPGSGPGPGSWEGHAHATVLRAADALRTLPTPWRDKRVQPTTRSLPCSDLPACRMSSPPRPLKINTKRVKVPYYIKLHKISSPSNRYHFRLQTLLRCHLAASVRAQRSYLGARALYKGFHVPATAQCSHALFQLLFI